MMGKIESEVTSQTPTVRLDRPARKGFTPTNQALTSPSRMPERVAPVPPLLSAGRTDKEFQAFLNRCRQIGTSLFFEESTSIRSLGFTSAIPGEGKTFLARLTAEAMAQENDVPVTLLECNWEHPTLADAYNLASGPGLSDLLLGRCSLGAVRRQVVSNLTVIPAGDNTSSAAKLLRDLQQKGVHNLLNSPDEVLILDLPATTTTAYGPLAAHLADALILVVRKGVTPESSVAAACNALKDLPMRGVIFNQIVSRIPGWLRRIL